MRVGAVIVAAGMSSRMGVFKPLLEIDGVSMIERIILRFAEAECSEIVVITGKDKDMLKERICTSSHIQKSDVKIQIAYNEEYETTQMFDSMKLGLEILSGMCDRIFLVPADVPSFTCETLYKLLATQGDYVKPSYHMQGGHPILLSGEVSDKILKDKGEGGLKKALERMGVQPVFVNVEDKGVILDADTKEDYQRILDYVETQKKKHIDTVPVE